jgi:hypothetical protein
MDRVFVRPNRTAVLSAWLSTGLVRGLRDRLQSKKCPRTRDNTGAPGEIRTPNLLIRRPRPGVRTGPGELAFTLNTAFCAPFAFAVVRDRLCDLAPRSAPRFAILIL